MENFNGYWKRFMLKEIVLLLPARDLWCRNKKNLFVLWMWRMSIVDHFILFNIIHPSWFVNRKLIIIIKIDIILMYAGIQISYVLNKIRSENKVFFILVWVQFCKTNISWNSSLNNRTQLLDSREKFQVSWKQIK